MKMVDVVCLWLWIVVKASLIALNAAKMGLIDLKVFWLLLRWSYSCEGRMIDVKVVWLW